MAIQPKKPHGVIRGGQLIMSYGPGAMADLKKHSVLVGGLAFWSAPRATINEERLAAKIAAVLSVPKVRLEAPPAADDTPGAPQTGVTVFQFPEWFVTQKALDNSNPNVQTRQFVHRKSIARGGVYIDRDKVKHTVVPIRFVRACRNGHIGDIDWFTFVHGGKTDCAAVGRRLFLDEHGTTGDIGEIKIRCECGKADRPMSAAAEFGNRTLGTCGGERPWLGPYMKESCSEANRLLVRTASNTYFPQRITVISLPERDEAVAAAVSAAWDFLETAEELEDVTRERRKAKVKEALDGISDEEVWVEIQARRGGGAAVDKTVKAAELETLITAKDETGYDVVEGTFFARSLPRSVWDDECTRQIERVVLVHRLREVSALIGFTRFESASVDAEGEADINVRRAALADPVDWVPAVENKGEGIFIQFRKEAIQKWMGKPAVLARAKQLANGAAQWKKDHPGNGGNVFPFSYVFLHSFSHLLLTAIALECGYPASSIKERIYAIDSIGYGVLLYTASADAEGTLGGLVDTGRRIHKLIAAALDLGRLCSNDPVCAQHNPASQEERRFLHGAACHGCQLIAETSCEVMNEHLDRALVVETVEGLGAEFFTDDGEQA